MSFLVNLAEGFKANLHDYEAKFSEWKRSDEPKLIARSYGALITLFTALIVRIGHFKDFESIAEEDTLSFEFKKNIDILRKKLVFLRAHREISSFDKMYKTVKVRRRLLRILREEHMRHGHLVDETHHGFDFVDSS